MAMEDERIIQLYFARNEEAISRTAENMETTAMRSQKTSQAARKTPRNA